MPNKHIDAGAPPSPVVRSSSGIREVLFDQVDRLRSGIATPAECNALATLCHKIGQTVLLEIQVARFASEMKNGRALPTPISLNGQGAGEAQPAEVTEPDPNG